MTEERAVEIAIRTAVKGTYSDRMKKMYPNPKRIYSGLCAQCGVVFFTLDRGLLCSRRCQGLDRRGAGHPAWTGGVSTTKSGYVVRTVHYDPLTGIKPSRLKPYHRIVMESHIGRPLHSFENVHHKNGIRNDNRIENLELWAKPQAPGQRVEDLISWVLDNYNAEIRAKIEIQDLVRSVIARVQSGEAL